MDHHLLDILSMNAFDTALAHKALTLSKSLSPALHRNMHFIVHRDFTQQYGHLVEAYKSIGVTLVEDTHDARLAFMKQMKKSWQRSHLLGNLFPSNIHKVTTPDQFLELTTFMDLWDCIDVRTLYASLIHHVDDFRIEGPYAHYERIKFFMLILHRHALMYEANPEKCFDHLGDSLALLNYRFIRSVVDKCEYIQTKIDYSETPKEDMKLFKDLHGFFQEYLNKTEQMHAQKIYTGPRGGRYKMIKGVKVYTSSHRSRKVRS